MAGSEQGTIECAVAVGPFHDAQRLRRRCERAGASDATEALRSRLIAATVEVLAEGSWASIASSSDATRVRTRPHGQEGCMSPLCPTDPSRRGAAPARARRVQACIAAGAAGARAR
jgi:hypothetical protein